MNIALAADALLEARGISNPTRKARVGAWLEAEFMLKSIHRRGL